jgi:hypothetical protein
LVDLELLELVVVLEEVHLGHLSLGVRRCRRHHANLRRGRADQGRGTGRERERERATHLLGRRGWEGRKRNPRVRGGVESRRLLGLEVVAV